MPLVVCYPHKKRHNQKLLTDLFTLSTELLKKKELFFDKKTPFFITRYVRLGKTYCYYI